MQLKIMVSKILLHHTQGRQTQLMDKQEKFVRRLRRLMTENKIDKVLHKEEQKSCLMKANSDKLQKKQ